MGEDIFLSQAFAAILLICTATTMFIFVSTRWIRPSGLGLSSFVKSLVNLSSENIRQAHVANTSPDYILTTILSSVVIGLTFARSLHYQFFAYLGWSSPVLLWKSGMPPVLIYLICGIQEWAWQQYPSTSNSSMAVLGCLFVQVCGIWFGTRKDHANTVHKAHSKTIPTQENSGTSKLS